MVLNTEDLTRRTLIGSLPDKTTGRLSDRGLISLRNGNFKLIDDATHRQIAGNKVRELRSQPVI